MRSSKRPYSSVRNRQKDKIASFVRMDKTTFKSAPYELVNNAPKRFVTPLLVYIYRKSNALYIQSQQFLFGVPMLLVKMFGNLRFETLSCGVNCYITSLS